MVYYQQIKDFVSKRLDRFQNLKVNIRYLINLQWKLKLRFFNFFRSNNLYSLDKTYWINPRRIVYAAVTKGSTEYEDRFKIFRDKGKIIGGDWDLPKNNKKFEDLDVYKAFYDHFKKNKKWKNTFWYNRIIKEISIDKPLWNCKNKEDFDIRLRGIDILHNEIKKDGYKIQKEIGGIEEDEVGVAIERKGHFLFTNGRHRLCIAKLLDIKKMPVKIIVRHEKWAELRKQLLWRIKKNKDHRLYQPLTHPDLADLPFLWDNQRFEIIKNNLSSKKGDLLDIGAYYGYFCHKFEEDGFNCYASEYDLDNLYLLKKLKEAENKRFKIIEGSILDIKEKNKFDVVLALNIFHHFLKDKASYKKLRTFLKNLKAKEMFFQAHNLKEDKNQMKNAYKNYSPEEFVQFILENSHFKEYKLIGWEMGRNIYKLY